MVTLCSSTAVAIVTTISVTFDTTVSIFFISETVPSVEFCMAAIFLPISSVASLVCFASSFTSLATTAKPLPASPALAASIVALRASNFVCSAISIIVAVTLDTSLAAAPSSSTFAAADCTDLCASSVIPRACSAFPAISPMVVVISSVAEATLFKLD